MKPESTKAGLRKSRRSSHTTPSPIRTVLLAACAAILLTPASAPAAEATLNVKDHLQVWLKADAGVATNATGAVTSWTDQSGNGNTATAVEDATAPSLVSNALNGKPVLRFDGNNDYLDVADAPSIQITGDIASFAVLRVDDFGNWRSVWGKTASNLPAPTDWYLVSGSGVPRVYRGDGTSSSLGAVDANRAVRAGTFLILAFQMEGTTLTHYLNGFPIGSGEITATLADGGTALKIGSRDDLVTRMKGDLAELLIYDAALSDTDRTAVFDYLKEKYGLQNLPPTVSVKAPANNAQFTAPTNIVVSVDASDADGTISRVDFLADGRVFATATAPPFSVPVSLVSSGTITFSATATDDKDTSVTSSPVQVTILGGAAPSYSPTSSLKLWLKADAGVTAGASGAVTAWKDQSGNNNNAAQSDEALAPRLVAQAVNSQPALYFDGTSKYLDVPTTDSLVMTGDITSLFVVEFDDFATYRAVWGKTASNLPRPTDYYALPGSGIPRFYRGNDDNVNAFVDGAGGFPTNRFLIAGFTHANPTATHWLNGNAFGRGTMNLATSDDGTPLRVGSREDLVTQLKGHLAELLVYNAALTQDEFDAVNTYLAGKYGIAVLHNLNQPPSVTLTNPVAGTTITTPADLTLQASATDTNGSVVRVAFYANGALVSTVTNSPYALSVQVTTPGSISFTAVATDNLGLSSTSAPVVVTASGPASSMTVTSGLKLWLKADAGVTADAQGVVSQWADQSGSANHAAQPDPVLSPKRVANAVNGQAVVRFDGTSQYLEFAGTGLALTGDLSSFFVVKCDDFATWRGVWGQTAGGMPAPNDYYLATGTGLPTFNRGDSAAVAGVSGQRAVPPGYYVVLGFDAVGQNITHYLNGTSNGAGVISVATADAGYPVRLGSRYDLVTQMKGDIAEVLIYDRGLSEAERATVSNYLARKYGVAFISVGSTSGAPSLTISGAATGITISWPASASGFVLESTAALANPTWTAVPNVQNNQVTIVPSGSAQFYRLRKP
jgi:hypothetical protein